MSCENTFTQTRFLGASVVSFNGSVGWNEETSSLSVTLVEDTKNGDVFTNPEVGTPVKFEFGDFYFHGLIQNWEKKESISGFIYDVVLVDPREILDGIQLILEGYSGKTDDIYNLWNVFGFWENADEGAGFGGSRVNEGGMPWNKIVEAISAIQNGSSFGSKANLKGNEYTINLSNLPITPDYYRIQGNTSSLLQAISQVCSDAGYDYIVDLDTDNDNEISFRTVSRKTQPSLDAIQRYIDSREDVSVKNRGLELRNEPTSHFVVGANRQRIYRSSLGGVGSSANIWPYWGLDRNGNAIIGTGTDDEHQFTVPCDVEGLEPLGGSYTMKVKELRAALAGQDEWKSYIAIFRPQVASEMNIHAPVNFSDELITLIQGYGATFLDTHNTKKDAVEATFDDNNTYITDRFYSFVKQYAEDFYGKKFMVTVPFVATQLESETGRLITSSEPSDAGYLEPGESQINLPLGLPTIYEDLFTNDDGRFLPFIRFDKAQLYNTDNLSPDVAFVYNWQLFVKCDIEPQFVYLNVNAGYSPRVVINLPGPVNSKPNLTEAPPHLEFVLAMMQEKGLSKEAFEKLRDKLVSFPIAAGYGPFANIPNATAVPLRSNVLTYGPWFVSGPPGKAVFEKDESLAPWNYGGYSTLNIAGDAKVENALMSQQTGESGMIELPDAPDRILGDAIVEGGPNITDISVAIGTEGVKTSYRLRTFTPSFGRFSRQNAERFQRISRQTLQLRRAMIKSLRKSGGNRSVESLNRKFITKDGPGFIGKSPHEVVVSTYYKDTGDKVRVATTSAKMGEAVASIIGKGGSYKNTAIMSYDGIFRGYSVDKNADEMPHFEEPVKRSDESYVSQNVFSYFPFSSHQETNSVTNGGRTDIKILSYGEEYPSDGINTFLTSHNAEKAKGIGLSGPLYMVGWGYDLFDRPVPNSMNDGDGVNPPELGSYSFLTDFRTKVHKWKAGPIDLRWDAFRKVWTMPYIIPGVYTGRNTVIVFEDEFNDTANQLEMELASFFNYSNIEANTKVLCYPMFGKLIIIAADCES